MHTTAIIAAGGRGRRLGSPTPKQFLTIAGRPILAMSVEAFVRHPRIDVVVVLPPEIAAAPPDYLRQDAKRITVVAGGERRQDSVAKGFEAVEQGCDVIVIHDAARPLVDAASIDRAIDGAREAGAAICAIPARDTVKLAEWDRGDTAERAWIDRTLPRDLVFLAQTPQAFRRGVLADALRLAKSDLQATDEASLAERAGHRVRLVEGSTRNIKITSAEDLALAESLVTRPGRQGSGGGPEPSLGREGTRARDLTPEAGETRIGLGYDIHRLVEGRRLILGGIELPFERGLVGHSDADVLCHAVTDAILGAAAAGDIGVHFPDTNAQWQGASSVELLRRAARLVQERGYAVANVDAVVIAERPRLAPFASAIVERLAEALQVPATAVSVKGKTNEGTGEIGRGEAIACQAVALLRRVEKASPKA